MVRLKAHERARAAALPSYLAVPGPSIPHPRQKVPGHISRRPDILLGNGQTLVQPRLPALYAHSAFTPVNSDRDEADYDQRDILPSDGNIPPTPRRDPTTHRRKREAQWRRWQGEVLPGLIPHYVRVLEQTRSLREFDKLPHRTRTNVCVCLNTKVSKIAIVHFSSVEDIEIEVCLCAPAAVQLMAAGAFPCAPLHPSLAVDLRVLEFALNLFVQIAPNNTAFTQALERTLATLGFQLDHKNSLRRRFGSCLMWYTHLRNRTKEHYSRTIEAVRAELIPESVEPVAPEQEDVPPTPRRSPTPTPRGRRPTRSRTPSSERSSSATPPTPTQARPAPRKRARSQTPELPFPKPLPRTRPSEYLRRRCPACFGGDLKRDPSSLSDVKCCIDACFTQKKCKSPKDPPKAHPNTHFVPEDVAVQTEHYVDSVRNVKKAKRPKATVEDEVEDDYEHPELPLPRSVLDGCEVSFKAADEKREKASTEFFEDTAIMALLCRHDRVLWLVNMHSAGERQFNVFVLVELLYQHLPPDIIVGLLYDVACALARSCRKRGFLSRYLDRLVFAVSVFHAFGHEWACQLLFHPRKRVGFGLTDGEGCERFWHSISHLIAHLRICGYHNRLYTLDAQIEHADETSLLRLGEWIKRRHLHCATKRIEARKVLAESGKPITLLREQWKMQVAAQTKPIARRSKKRGEKAVEAVILLRTAVKTMRKRVADLEASFLEAVEEDDPDAPLVQVQVQSAEEALSAAVKKLRQKEAALGVHEKQALTHLGKSKYMGFRMNARALKRRIRDRLRSRKFELDKIERSFRRLVNDQKLYSHTESAVKRREPTIAKLNTQYNKLCTDMAQAIKDGHAPPGAIAPAPIPAKQLWTLDVDDGIWQDVGLDDDDADGAPEEPPLWLSDEKVRSGIKAMLELDRCDEEDIILKKERCALQVWFAEEWKVVNHAIAHAGSAGDKYQLELRRNELVALCATWQKSLPDLGVAETTLPPWGPSAVHFATCVLDAHLPARGEDRHYDDGDDGIDEEIESGGEDVDFGTLDAIETADIYRNAEDNDYL
ncbi:hypothetical protein C8R44DRAFT_740749 [Mycena epipterygia]|nr:hypothetical protein C8R44DRAFT_740749 [Mycena epipterygia]